ncbi:MAG: c-type cytochrome [Planctomycetota bacterium]
MSRTSSKISPWFGGITLFLLGACGDQPATPTHDPPPTADQAAVGEEAQTSAEASDRGAEIYRVSCALCHGETGDGKGIVVLDRPARSFIDGGFSFGNTPEALFRTVSNGIGGTPMPGFSETMSEEDRHAVVAHVLTLMPAPETIVPGSTVLSVTDRPQVARGSFPPVMDGLAMSARGLLLGGLDGMSFQYDASDMRLLAVRLGDFVDRRDWENRGGDAMLPLGVPIFLFDGGDPGSMWERTSVTAAVQPLQAKLLATEIAGGKAWVEYALLEDGVQLALVRESGQALSRGGWTGFRRSFEVLLEQGFEGALVLSDGALAAKPLFPDLAGRTVRQEDPQFGSVIRHRREFQLDGGFHLNEDLLFGLEGTEQQLQDLQEALR